MTLQKTLNLLLYPSSPSTSFVFSLGPTVLCNPNTADGSPESLTSVRLPLHHPCQCVPWKKRRGRTAEENNRVKKLRVINLKAIINSRWQRSNKTLLYKQSHNLCLRMHAERTRTHTRTQDSSSSQF